MDNVTHTLAGVAIANGFFRKRAGPEAVGVLAAASNVTDLDVAVLWTRDPYAVTLRRTWGHSIFVAPLLALALSAVFKKAYPKASFGAIFGLCLLGIAVHLLMDLINSFGVVLFWPFSGARPEFAFVFIIDVVLAGILAAPLLACLPRRRRPRLDVASRIAVTAAALYVAFCGVNRRLARRALARVDAAGWTYVFPEPFGPQRWRGVAGTGGGYRLYLIHSWTGRVEPRGFVASRAGDADVERVRATPAGRRLERFFKAPVWDVERESSDGAVVTAYDLRFRSLLLPRRAAFTYRFRVDPRGAVAAL